MQRFMQALEVYQKEHGITPQKSVASSPQVSLKLSPAKQTAVQKFMQDLKVYRKERGIEPQQTALVPKTPTSASRQTASVLPTTLTANRQRSAGADASSSAQASQSQAKFPESIDFAIAKEYTEDATGKQIQAFTDDIERKQQNVNAVAKLPRITCIHEKLAGKRHPTTGVLYTERVVAVDGQRYIVVAPEFDSMFDAQLPEELRYARDKKQFKECTLQLWNAVQGNPRLKAMFTEKQLRSIEKGQTPKGYTWHHDAEIGRMQLVLTEIHSKTGHTGGRSIWGGGREHR